MEPASVLYQQSGANLDSEDVYIDDNDSSEEDQDNELCEQDPTLIERKSPPMSLDPPVTFDLNFNGCESERKPIANNNLLEVIRPNSQ